MKALRATAVPALLVGIAAWLAPALSSADPATAEALFREGRRLLEEGKTEEACLTLTESQAQDASSGTLLNLGLCHERQHKLATAWSDYVSAGRLAREQGRADRVVVAEKKAAELEPRLPHLTVTVAAPIEGLEIARGAQRLASVLMGIAVPIDPGSYVITARAPGRTPWSTTIDLAEAEAKTVEVPDLDRAPAERETKDDSGAPSVVIAPPPPPPAAAAAAGSGSGPLGWILGGSGVASLAVGAGFGVASLVSYHNASTLCPSHQNCTAGAMSARSSAESSAWVSNVTLGTGVVLTGFGTWILLRGWKGGPTTGVRVEGGMAGFRVSLERSF